MMDIMYGCNMYIYIYIYVVYMYVIVCNCMYSKLWTVRICKFENVALGIFFLPLEYFYLHIMFDIFIDLKHMFLRVRIS